MGYFVFFLFIGTLLLGQHPSAIDAYSAVFMAAILAWICGRKTS